MAIEPIVGVAHERLEGLGIRTLDAAEKILAPGGTQPNESAGIDLIVPAELRLIVHPNANLIVRTQ